MPTDQPREQLRSALNLARSGDYAGARRELEELLRAVPDFADGHYYLGLACERSGDSTAARAAFERCLEIDPFYHEAREQLRGIAPPAEQPFVEGPNPTSAEETESPLPVEDYQPPAPPPPLSAFEEDLQTPVRAPLETPPMESPRMEPLRLDPERILLPPIPPVLPPIEESPEQENWSPILVKPGGFWIRGLAWLIDMVLTSFALAPFLPFLILPFYGYLEEYFDLGREAMTQKIAEQFLSGDTQPLLILSLYLLLDLTVKTTFNMIVFGYYHYVSGQSPGKRLLGVRVVDVSSLDYLTIGQSIWRYAASTLNPCTCMVGYVMAGFNPEKRALHDYLASTRVVYSERVPMETLEKAATAVLVLFAAAGILFTIF